VAPAPAAAPSRKKSLRFHPCLRDVMTHLHSLAISWPFGDENAAGYTRGRAGDS